MIRPQHPPSSIHLRFAWHARSQCARTYECRRLNRRNHRYTKNKERSVCLYVRPEIHYHRASTDRQTHPLDFRPENAQFFSFFHFAIVISKRARASVRASERMQPKRDFPLPLTSNSVVRDYCTSSTGGGRKTAIRDLQSVKYKKERNILLVDFCRNWCKTLRENCIGCKDFGSTVSSAEGRKDIVPSLL